MEGYCVTCVFECLSDKVSDFEKLIDLVYSKSLQEKGCREYRWYQSHETPSTFLLFMTWENKQAFEDHVKSKHVKVSHSGSEQYLSLEKILRKPYKEAYWKFLPV